MANDELGWGLIATGAIATKFSEDLALVDGARKVAVCSRNGEKAKAFAARHGYATAYGDLEQFLADPQIDAVYIASPNSAHRTQALAAIKAGKAVLVEKPLAMTAAASRSIADAANEKHVFAMEAMWSRFLPAAQRAKALIESGAIGKPMRAEASLGYKRTFAPESRLFNRTLGGGVLYDLGVYPLSIALMLFGDAERASSSWKQAPSGVDIEADVRLSCSGVPVDMSLSFAADKENSFVVYGTEGALRLDRHFLRGRSLTIWKRPLERAPVAETSLAGRILKRLPAAGQTVERFDYPGHGLHFEIRAAQAAILSGKTVSGVMPIDESARVIGIIEDVLYQPSRS